MHPRVEGIHVCSDEGPCSFPRGDDNDSRTTWPISTKLDTKYPWVMRSQVGSNEGPHLLSKGDNYEIAKI